MSYVFDPSCLNVIWRLPCPVASSSIQQPGCRKAYGSLYLCEKQEDGPLGLSFFIPPVHGESLRSECHPRIFEHQTHPSKLKQWRGSSVAGLAVLLQPHHSPLHQLCMHGGVARLPQSVGLRPSIAKAEQQQRQGSRHAAYVRPISISPTM